MSERIPVDLRSHDYLAREVDRVKDELEEAQRERSAMFAVVDAARAVTDPSLYGGHDPRWGELEDALAVFDRLNEEKP